MITKIENNCMHSMTKEGRERDKIFMVENICQIGQISYNTTFKIEILSDVKKNHVESFIDKPRLTCEDGQHNLGDGGGVEAVLDAGEPVLLVPAISPAVCTQGKHGEMQLLPSTIAIGLNALTNTNI